MSNKPSAQSRFPLTVAALSSTDSGRWNDGDGELCVHARAFHMAARTLAESAGPDSGPLAEFGASPVVFMYRQAVELHLKVLVLEEGGNFLSPRPDPLAVSASHSLTWLAQFVRQIITRLGWEPRFTCEGVENLDDFWAVMIELSAAGLAARAGIDEFARRMDALLDLLDATADALEEEWDARLEFSDSWVEWPDGFTPTIQ
jgi:hypothetical protein